MSPFTKGSWIGAGKNASCIYKAPEKVYREQEMAQERDEVGKPGSNAFWTNMAPRVQLGSAGWETQSAASCSWVR